jgi:uncharacterized protein (DUF1800 family)
MDGHEVLVLPLPKKSGIAGTDAVFAKYANAALPKRAAVSTGLEAYAGTWDQRHATHLLRRVLFGFTKADLDKAMSLNAATCVDTLLNVIDETIAPPVVVETTDTVPPGQTWVTAAYDGTLDGPRRRSFQYWWMGLIANQSFSIREKMVVFWHNHFPSELDVIGDARYGYAQNALFRKSALGNFKALVKQVTLDPAMLRYLNGNTNTNKNPNENYGRELQELFTVGKGPEIAAGNYTNYTEEDVKAAARVLTGWRDVRDTITAEFIDKSHDATDKAFSSAYGSTVIKGRAAADGAKEVDDLMDMIFAQTETARAFCRSLYRFFIYYAIDDTVEKNIIQPLADAFIAGGFEVKPILATLFKSAHFHDALNMGCVIKNPLDLAAGSFRQLAASAPDGSVAATQYAFWGAIHGEAARMQMEIGNPPNVAGWPAYYQNPVFYELWINSDTLPRRVQLTDKLASSKGYVYGADKTVSLVDAVAFAQTTARANNVANLVSDLSDLLFPITLTDVQLLYLKNVMMGDLPDYEWGAEWNAYVAAPTDAKLKSAVDNRLRDLLRAMMEMAEYQLC